MARVYEGECMGDENLALKRSQSCGLSQLYEVFEGWMEVSLWPSLQLKGIKGEVSFFSFLFSFASLLLFLISWHDVCYPCIGRM